MVLAGKLSISACYMACYGGGEEVRPSKSQRTEASRLYRSAPLSGWLDRQRARVESNLARKALSTRSAVESGLWEEARNADRSSDRIAALRLLGQTASMFAERVEVAEVEALSSSEVVAEIEAELRSLIGASPASPDPELLALPAPTDRAEPVENPETTPEVEA